MIFISINIIKTTTSFGSAIIVITIITIKRRHHMPANGLLLKRLNPPSSQRGRIRIARCDTVINTHTSAHTRANTITCARINKPLHKKRLSDHL